MRPGSVILAHVQQSDGGMKKRHAVVLSFVPPYQDLLICGVSSELQHRVAGFDEVVRLADADFRASGLKVESLIRLGLLATIPASSVVGALGAIAPARLLTLRRNLARHVLSAEEAQPSE